MKKITLIFSVLVLIILSICYSLSQDKELNYLPHEEPQLSDYDSIVRSFYLSNLIHSSQFVVDTISDNIPTVGFALKMDKIIREYNDTILKESHYGQVVHPETFWKHRFRLQFCDCFWEANFFNFGTPKTHIRGLKGTAVVELTISNKTESIYKGGKGEFTGTFSFRDEQNLEESILDVIKEGGKTLFSSEVVSPKDTLTTFKMMRNNPSRIFNEKEVLSMIQKIVKTLDKSQKIFTLKARATRIKQGRKVYLQVNYQGEKSFRAAKEVGYEVQALGYEISHLEIY